MNRPRWMDISSPQVIYAVTQPKRFSGTIRMLKIRRELVGTVLRVTSVKAVGAREEAQPGETVLETAFQIQVNQYNQMVKEAKMGSLELANQLFGE